MTQSVDSASHARILGGKAGTLLCYDCVPGVAIVLVRSGLLLRSS